LIYWLKMKVHRVIRRADSVPVAINGDVTSQHSDVRQTENSRDDVISSMTTSIKLDPRRSRPVAERARMYAAASKSQQPQRRLVSKTGDCNVSQSHVTIRKGKYLADLFTTVVDMRWRWHVIMAATAFLVTWIAFAVAWLAMAHAHHDIGQSGNDTHAPCIDHVYDFRSALLFSMETQTTIGYGYRVLQRHCPEGVLLLMLQSCIGVSMQVSIQRRLHALQCETRVLPKE
jgi:Inward rectifier potassium channel transmembrane domain